VLLSRRTLDFALRTLFIYFKTLSNCFVKRVTSRRSEKMLKITSHQNKEYQYQNRDYQHNEINRQSSRLAHLAPCTALSATHIMPLHTKWWTMATFWQQNITSTAPCDHYWVIQPSCPKSWQVPNLNRKLLEQQTVTGRKMGYPAQLKGLQ